MRKYVPKKKNANTDDTRYTLSSAIRNGTIALSSWHHSHAAKVAEGTTNPTSRLTTLDEFQTCVCPP